MRKRLHKMKYVAASRAVFRPIIIAISLAAALIVSDSGIRRQVAFATPSASDAIQPWDNVYGIARSHSGTWCAVGAKGLLVSSDNQGGSWSAQPRFTDRDLYTIAFSPDGESGWIAGEGGLIYQTTDSAKSWRAQASLTTERILNIAAADPQRIAAVATNGILLWTQDGGQHWHTQKFKDWTFFDVKFVDGAEGWAVGEFQSILHTLDGGKTWQVQYGAPRKDFRVPPFFTFTFRNKLEGWVVGVGGVFASTRDGGKTWQVGQLPQKTSIYAADFRPMDQVLILGGADGNILQAHWNGRELENWRSVQPVSNSIAGVKSAGPIALAVGMNGTILKSIASQADWRLQTPPTAVLRAER